MRLLLSLSLGISLCGAPGADGRYRMSRLALTRLVLAWMLANCS